LPFSSRIHAAVLESGKVKIATVRSLLDRFRVDILIRLHAAEFSMLSTIRQEFVHFNLETTLNQVGHRCAVVPIVTPGHRTSDGREVLPVIDPARSRLGTCVKVLHRIPLGEISGDLFRHSLPTIRTADQLRAALLQRYAGMFPNMSENEIVERGCAITKLHFDE
jgi:hypothetical protein